MQVSFLKKCKCSTKKCARWKVMVSWQDGQGWRSGARRSPLRISRDQLSLNIGDAHVPVRVEQGALGALGM